MKNLKISYILLFMILVTNSLFAQHDKYFYYPYEGRSVLSRTQGSTWLSLQPGQPVELHPGDYINVEGSGRGEITFPDGTSVRMKNNAMITLGRYNINLRFGYVWLNVRRSADMFKVTTPMGTCSVLGTSFDVDVDKYGKSKVRVFQGIVALRASDDERNKQLVLQAGMESLLAEATKVADKPNKFQHQSIEASMRSEWEQRSVYKGLTQQKPSDSQAVEAPKISTEDGFLPIIRSDRQVEMDFKPIEKILDKEPGQKEESQKPEKIQIIARQRSEFAESLRQQQLERDSVIGFSIPEKASMLEDGHGLSFGESSRTPSTVTDQASLEREIITIRNKLMKIQNDIRETKLEIRSLIALNDSSTGVKMKISKNQQKLNDLYSENRLLQNKLKELQHKKR